MKFLFLASFLTLATPAWCQTPVQDFSKGFELLAGLGLPPLDSSATWTKAVGQDRMDYELRQHTRSIKGNSWLIRDKDGKLKQLTLGSLEVVDLPPDAKELPAQDITKDVESIIDALQKAVTKQDPDELLYSYRHSSLDPFLIFAAQLHQTGRKDLANRLALATFAFFPTRETAIDTVVNRIAEQAHQKTASAFFSSGDWATYHRDLTALTERFPRGWSSREAARLMLPQLARQAKGETAPDPTLPGSPLAPEALAILRELMQPPKRDAQPGNAAPGMEGMDDMPPEVRQQIMMMQARGHFIDYGGPRGFHQDLWLLQDIPANSTDPQSRLARLGMAALPALAAAAEDPFFTYQRNQNSSSHYYSSGESEDERTLRAYQSMTRPATRGEIATRMLTLTLPDPENELRQADAQSLRDAALEFWKTHQKSTREQLAAVFLKEGSSQQAAQAVEILAQSKNPDAHKMFEDHVLAADPAIAVFTSVQTYLKARKAEGKPFFDRYAQLVRKQTADAGGDTGEVSDPFGGGYSSASWQIREAGGVEKILKQLQALAEGESPRAMAIRIGKEETIKTAPAAVNALMEAMDAEEPKKQLIALLSGAYAASKDENVRALFLNSIFRISWGKGGEDDGGEDPAPDGGIGGDDAAPDAGDADNPDATEKKPATRTISEAEAKVWQRLIADSRPLKISRDSGSYSASFRMPTVSALACAALESSVCVDDEYYRLMSAIPILARPAQDVMTERAKARLAGKAVPALPDAKKIKPERLTAIVSEAAGKPTAELHTYLSTLSIDERAAWAEWLEDPGEIPMPDNVKQARFQVVKLADAPAYAGETIPDFNAIPVGFQISEKSFLTLVDTLASQSAKHSRGMIGLSPTDFGPGLEAGNARFPFPEPKKDDEELDGNPYGRTITAADVFSEAMSFFEEDDKADAILMAEIDTDTENEEAAWTIKDGKATRYHEEGEDKSEDKFAQVLKSTVESGESSSIRLQIQILTRADAEKLNPNNE